MRSGPRLDTKDEIVNKPQKLLKKIIIIGAGISGLSLAIELRKKFWDVLVLDEKDPLCGATGINPGRLGHGFHYPLDEATALFYLNQTIQFRKNHKDTKTYIIGQDLPENHPIRCGRYYMAKKDTKKFLEVFEKLRSEYKRLCELDSGNQVLGKPENFFRRLEKQEYENDIYNCELYDAIETTEALLDLGKYKNDLLKKVEELGIAIEAYIHVEDVKKDEDSYYRIRAHDKDGKEKFYRTHFLGNCAWQNAQSIENQLGFKTEERTNRVKGLLTVELKEGQSKFLLDTSDNGVMLSHLGKQKDGPYKGMCIGKITFAAKTNIGFSSEIDLPEKLSRYTENKISSDERNQKMLEIFNGAASILPELRDARPLEINFGVVITAGKFKFNDPTSGHHSRTNPSGVIYDEGRYVRLTAMKLDFAPQEAPPLVDALERGYEWLERIHSVEQIPALSLSRASTEDLKPLSRSTSNSEGLGGSNASDFSPPSTLYLKNDSKTLELTSRSNSNFSNNDNVSDSSESPAGTILVDRELFKKYKQREQARCTSRPSPDLKSLEFNGFIEFKALPPPALVLKKPLTPVEEVNSSNELDTSSKRSTPIQIKRPLKKQHRGRKRVRQKKNDEPTSVGFFRLNRAIQHSPMAKIHQDFLQSYYQLLQLQKKTISEEEMTKLNSALLRSLDEMSKQVKTDLDLKLSSFRPT